jgi:hypothetical protein
MVQAHLLPDILKIHMITRDELVVANSAKRQNDTLWEDDINEDQGGTGR